MQSHANVKGDYSLQYYLCQYHAWQTIHIESNSKQYNWHCDFDLSLSVIFDYPTVADTSRIGVVG